MVSVAVRAISSRARQLAKDLSILYAFIKNSPFVNNVWKGAELDAETRV